MATRPSHTSAVIVAIAIVAAALLAPVAAVAAGQLVEISSASGRKADVTRAEQLQTAEASPHQFIRGYGSTSSICRTVLTAPATKAVVITSAAVSFTSIEGTIRTTLYVTSGGCDTDSVIVANVHASAAEFKTLDFGPGITVPAGGQLVVTAAGGSTYVAAFGYKVAPSAVTS